MSDTDVVVTRDRDDNSTNVITESLKIYGSDVISTKFPVEIDGCKDVVRHIVWTAREYTNFIKIGRLAGDVMSHHPSGDAPILDAAYRLGRSFMVGHPILSSVGAIGPYYDTSQAAAPRYVSVTLSDFARDVFFNGVHLKTIPQHHNKDFSEMVAKTFIPRLPMSLILGNLSVGYAFKSAIHMVDIHDVCDAVIAYSEYYKKGGIGMPPYKAIAKYLIPSYPIPGIIKNRQAILESYAKGDYSIKVLAEGTSILTGTSFTLKSLPYSVDFGKTTDKFRQLLIDRHSHLKDMVTSANQYSSSEAEFTVEFKKGYNAFTVFDILKRYLAYNESHHYIYNYNKDGSLISSSPALVLQKWYTARYLSIAGGLKYRQSSLISKKIELEAILLITEYMDEVIDLIRSSIDTRDAVCKLHDRFRNKKLSWNQAEIISRQPLTRLAQASPKELQSELDKVKSDLAGILASFSKIHDVIKNDAEYFKKKYKSTKQTQYSDDYIGYVQFGNHGIINFFDNSEIASILSLKGWPADMVKTIHKYKSQPHQRHYILNGRMYPITDPSKVMRCERIVEISTNRLGYTLCISKGNASIIDREILDTKAGGYSLMQVGQEFYAIHRDGSIHPANVSDFTIRKNVSRGAKSKIIYGLPHTTKDVIVIHASDGEPNVIRADRVLVDGKLGTLKTSASGQISVLGVYPYNTNEIIVNVPKECTRGFNITHLFIKDLYKLFEYNDSMHHVISVSRTTGWSNTNIKAKIVRSNEVKTVYTLDLSSVKVKGSVRDGKSSRKQ